jgi:hypothetical protein
MSHPDPMHDIENERTEDSSFAPRKSIKHKALSNRIKGHKKLNPAQKSTSKWLHEAGKHIRKQGEPLLHHLKRLTK